MSNETLFFICGIGLAVSAVLFSIAGLKVKNFPGKAFPVVVLWFAILVGGATTFAVLHAKDEEKAKAAEFEKAGKEFEAEGNDDAAGAEAPTEKGGGAKSAPAAAAKGPGGTVQLEADPTEIAYDTTELSSKPGKVMINFDNPSSIPHNVEVENASGKVLGGTETFASSEESTEVALAPGTYTFFCSVPGHREAGMEGTLVVK